MRGIRVFIGKHPCDDLPYIVGTEPDPRSGDRRFTFEGPDYSGYYIREPRWLRAVWPFADAWFDRLKWRYGKKAKRMLGEPIEADGYEPYFTIHKSKQPPVTKWSK